MQFCLPKCARVLGARLQLGAAQTRGDGVIGGGGRVGLFGANEAGFFMVACAGSKEQAQHRERERERERETERERESRSK